MSDAVTRLNAALEGHYAIERELGEGGMATVYLADDLRHERKVALKVLKPELAAVVGAQRFLAEIKTTANLQHPHILQLYDSGEVDGFLYFVMPFVEGETLRERIDREKQLPVEEAVALARAVAGALQAAHERGVVHRDIKPANILLSHGEPLVADFGIALAVQQAGGGRLTETGMSVGTPYYMSPEQATADRDPDARSDIYSLGCVLYEMLTGEPPFTGHTAQAVLGKILTGSPASPTEIRPAIPAHVESVALKALERLPADRFSSAASLADALVNPAFRHGPADEAATPNTEAVAEVAALRRRTRVFAGATALLAGALALSLLPLGDGPAASGVVEFVVRGDSTHTIGASVPGSLALSPDGRTLAYIGSNQGMSRIYVRPLAERAAQPIPGTEAARDVIFSYDGTRLAFSTNNNDLRTVRLAGGSPTSIVTLSGALLGAYWGPDDRIVYGVGGREGLMRVSASGGAPEELVPQDTTLIAVLDPWSLPERDVILFTGVGATGLAAGGREIFALDARSDEVIEITAGITPRYALGHLVYGSPDGTVFAHRFDPERLELAGEPVRIAEGVGGLLSVSQDMAVSPTGAIAYIQGTTDVGRDLFLQRTDLRVTENLFSRAGLRSPRISPEGDRILYALPATAGSDGSLYVYSLSQRTHSLVASSATEGGSWSPDGGSVIYTATYVSGSRSRQAIWTVPVGGGEPLALFTEDVGLQGVQPAYTWDGQHIVFERGTGERDIMAILADGSGEPIPIAASAANESQARPSPSHPWVAYTSDETGRPEVYVAHLDGGSRTPVSSAGGMSPVWSMSGDTLFYYEGPTLVAAAMSLGDQAVVQGRGATSGARSFLDTPGAPAQYDMRANVLVYVGGGGSNSGNSIVVRTSFLPSGPSLCLRRVDATA